MNRGMIVLLVLMLSVIWSVFAAPVNASHVATDDDYNLSADMLGRINRLRGRRGLPPYQLNQALNIAAQNQADWLVETGLRRHTRPDGSKPSDRVEEAGYISTGWCCGENYYLSIDATPDMVWEFWIWSPMHHINLVHREFDTVGVGHATDGYRISYVLVFGNVLDDGDVLAVPDAVVIAAPPTAAPPPVIQQQESPVTINTSLTGTHIVAPGETLFRIALNYNTTAAAIASANNLRNVNTIYVGQRLIIPTGTQTIAAQAIPPLSQTTPSQTTCRGLRATSPTDGLPNGSATFYWEPIAQSISGYQVNIYDEVGQVVGQFLTTTGNTSLSADVGIGNIGSGFSFAWEVVALNNGVPVCRSNRIGLFRESP